MIEYRFDIKRLAALIIPLVIMMLVRSHSVSAEEQNPPKRPAKRTPASAPRLEPAPPVTVQPPAVTPIATPPPAPPAVQAPPKGIRTPAVNAFEGVYFLDSGPSEVKVHCLLGDVYHLSSSEGWEGVGILDGLIYRGVYRQVSRGGEAGALGNQTIDWSDHDRPLLKTTYTRGGSGELEQRLSRLDPSKPRAVTPPPPPAGGTGRRPEFGEYVYVEELPEAITKVAPVYPDEARKKGIDGVVLVQALVVEDGTVGDTRVVNSIPGLDDAAVAAIRQWRFKPAMAEGKPVAVWVATPVRFSLR